MLSDDVVAFNNSSFAGPIGVTLTIAIEGGATTTTATLYGFDLQPIQTCEAGPSNPASYGPNQAAAVLASLAESLLHGRPEVCGRLIASLAGAGDEQTRIGLANELARRVASEIVVITDDLRPVLFANANDCEAALVIAGTGSSVLTCTNDGVFRVFGGRGRIASDEGSAYAVAVNALRAVSDAADGASPCTHLTAAFLEHAGAASLRALFQWVESATKQDIAALSIIVVSLAEQGDETAHQCVEDQVRRLAQLASTAYRETPLSPGAKLFFHGGLIRGSAYYAGRFREIMADTPAQFTFSEARITGPDAVLNFGLSQRVGTDAGTTCLTRSSDSIAASLPSTERTPTHSRPLDDLSPLEIVDAMCNADRDTSLAVRRSDAAIARAIEWAADAITGGGRIVYVGAGTSGRLGVLDASECPPTFGISSERVVGVIAGGEKALRSAVEGAEDDTSAGERDMAAISPPIGIGDLIVGIAASGNTPYTRAAMEWSKARGANTVLLCCNPSVQAGGHLLIALDTGAEVLPGSTRLKAGTATKLVLNMISTGAFAIAGYVFAGHMIGVHPSNAKLRARAIRIVTSLTGKDENPCRAALEATDWSVAASIIMLRLGMDAQSAIARLRKADGILRRAL